MVPDLALSGLSASSLLEIIYAWRDVACTKVSPLTAVVFVAFVFVFHLSLDIRYVCVTDEVRRRENLAESADKEERV